MSDNRPKIGRVPVRMVCLVIAVALLCSCSNVERASALKPSRGSETTSRRSDLYRGEFSFVRIEAAEAGAAANQLPAVLTESELRQALAVLKGKQNDFADQALFTTAELDEVVAPLSVALAKAQSNEDVIFAVAGYHGATGILHSRSVNTGRLFIVDGKLNLIVGLAQVNFENELRGNRTLRSFTPGSRAQIVDSQSRVAGGLWQQVKEGRDDWQAVLLSQLPQPTVEVSAAAPTEEPLPSNRIEQRLRALDRLKQQGLITDSEYQEKRKEILKDL